MEGLYTSAGCVLSILSCKSSVSSRTAQSNGNKSLVTTGHHFLRVKFKKYLSKILSFQNVVIKKVNETLYILFFHTKSLESDV